MPKKLLIEALHCDSACAKIHWTPLPLAKMHLESKDQWQLLITETTSKMGHGYALDLGVYINYPVIYQNYLGILRGEIFQIKKEYQDQAIEIINDIKKTKTIDEELNVKHFNLIGVHARYTDYKYHLKQRGGQYLKPTFFIKAMNYFRQKYENPLFLLVSDEVPKAKKIIIDSQPEYQDIVFVGTIDDARWENVQRRKYGRGSSHHVTLSACDYDSWNIWLVEYLSQFTRKRTYCC